MANRTVIYQPCYYPKIHYLSRINNADEFIIFDDVEFSRRSRQHRAEINFGNKRWLTIPIQHTGSNTTINDALIDNSQRWQDKHVGTLKHKYGSDTALFETHYAETEESNNPYLSEFTISILLELLEQFNVNTSIHRSSELPVSHPGDPSEYLAQLTEYVSGDVYVCGQSVYDGYLEEQPFSSRDIEVSVQDWTPNWPEGNVCSLDVLFNADNPEEIIK